MNQKDVSMTTRRALKKPDERRVWFEYQLKLKGSSYSAIAVRLGVSRQAVRQLILNPPPKMASVVAVELGKSRSELWPHRYAA